MDLKPEQWDAWGLDSLFDHERGDFDDTPLDDFMAGVDFNVSGVSIHTTFVVSGANSGGRFNDSLLAEQLEDVTQILTAYDQYNASLVRLASSEDEKEAIEPLIKDVFERKAHVQDLVDEYYHLYGVVLGIEL